MKFIFKSKKIFHLFAALTCEILFPIEDKLHIFEQTCNFLIITLIHVLYECFENKTKNRQQKTKEKQRNDVSNIFTSEDI